MSQVSLHRQQSATAADQLAKDMMERAERVGEERRRQREQLAKAMESIDEMSLSERQQYVQKHKDMTEVDKEMLRMKQTARLQRLLEESDIERQQARRAIELNDMEYFEQRKAIVDNHKTVMSNTSRERIDTYKKSILYDEFIEYTPKNAMEIAQAYKELQEESLVTESNHQFLGVSDSTYQRLSQSRLSYPHHPAMHAHSNSISSALFGGNDVGTMMAMDAMDGLPAGVTMSAPKTGKKLQSKRPTPKTRIGVRRSTNPKKSS